MVTQGVQGTAGARAPEVGTAPSPAASWTVSSPSWRTRYVRRIMVGDLVAGIVAATVGYVARFGSAAETSYAPAYRAAVLIACLLPFVWVSAMLVARTYEQRFLWVGPEEFRRVFSAAVSILAAVGTVSWAFKLEVARGLVVVALPLATLLTLLQRFLQRRWLHRRRGQGLYQQTLLIVGHRNGVQDLHAQIDREAYQGYRVVGCCLPSGQRGAGGAELFDRLPVLGDLGDVVDVVRAHHVDTVAVLPSPELDSAALRRLGWGLEATDAELLLAPAVTDIAGPRVNIRPICGLPLLHMERPELRGVRRVAKTSTDVVISSGLLLALLPVLLVIALAVKASSRGPVFFKQERIGRDGRPFRMLKFRSMVVGAEQMTEDIVVDDGNGVLFKLREDPRVTRVGKLLRRYSLDELPQLFNILGGSMSLVGPRPPLAAEVERYGDDMHRRFLVKPGLTGLWQVSGRSDLSWDDSVRIDVRYVENWSLAFDFMIMWKTVGAVVRGSGAY
ncbi:exopolysaccharide biosynthesis polyprenyl glycosylphosphotransferase [Modestobacter sp. I12A-02628]|uniref:Sugar transferase n=1 Tax=Goekera deserti TaxID=2497753 RepID=A0A7K3WEW4_9ACTN|nr:sugar transferase [Goekera deserti]MPQ97944.1 exopolysaccharide biosynthesis polyprenyl glycosylphosphotransferase [Goekera deserti]NDI48590.1 exopolysaccharide biosynthesis polyprenyl glycosylphosphotransferase [Goekera deserti]NEL55031.1 sugar transferase [Goekera deserti]